MSTSLLLDRLHSHCRRSGFLPIPKKPKAHAHLLDGEAARAMVAESSTVVSTAASILNTLCKSLVAAASLT